MRRTLTFCLLGLLAVTALRGADYYMAPDGRDTASGLTPGEPMATVAAILAKVPPPATAPVVIWLKGGRYELAATIKIGRTAAPLTLTAMPGEKPILDGSVRLSGWQDAELNQRKVWVADVPAEIPADRLFRLLYVNGALAPRSCWPARGDLIVADSPDGMDNTYVKRFQAAAGDLCPLDNPTEVEVSLMHYWVHDRLQIAAYDPVQRLITTVNSSGVSLREAHPLHEAGNARYRLENVRAGLLTPGQWYLDHRARKVYYLPRAGETPANTEIRVPRLIQLIRVQGDAAQNHPVENVRLEGLAFEHTDVDFFLHLGTHNWAPCTGPGVVCFAGVKNCAIEDCDFHAIGEYGIELAPGSSDVTIAGNRFTDLGCGAVKTMGSTLSAGPATARTWMNRIVDNTILRGGRFYADSPGILATHPLDFVIAHNEIADFYYNGIAICGGGGMSELAALECRIEANRIHQIGQGLLSDMGAIYLNSMNFGTIVRGNVAYDVKSKVYGGNILYLDDSSSQITVEDNLFYDASDQVLLSKGRNNVARNNILAFAGKAIVRVGERDGKALETLLLMHNVLLSRGAPIFADMPGVPILERSGILSDANLVWSKSAGGPTVATHHNGPHPAKSFTWKEWLERAGNDRCSLVAAPGFGDPATGDFSLKADSPAFAAGYSPIDFSRVGPRSRAEREAEAKATAKAKDPRTTAQ